MFYVTCTDRFCSGWGSARDKISKMVFPFQKLENAIRKEAELMKRSDTSYVSLRETKPYYSPKKYYVKYFEEEA